MSKNINKNLIFKFDKKNNDVDSDNNSMPYMYICKKNKCRLFKLKDYMNKEHECLKDCMVNMFANDILLNHNIKPKLKNTPYPSKNKNTKNNKTKRRNKHKAKLHIALKQTSRRTQRQKKIIKKS